MKTTSITKVVPDEYFRALKSKYREFDFRSIEDGPQLASSAYKSLSKKPGRSGVLLPASLPARADVCFALASVTGMVPHPSRTKEFLCKSLGVALTMTRDYNRLAELIDQYQARPPGRHLPLKGSDEEGLLLTWLTWFQARSRSILDGARMWATLLIKPPREQIRLVQANRAKAILKQKKSTCNALKIWPAALVSGCTDSKEIWGEPGQTLLPPIVLSSSCVEGPGGSGYSRLAVDIDPQSGLEERWSEIAQRVRQSPWVATVDNTSITSRVPLALSGREICQTVSNAALCILLMEPRPDTRAQH